MTLSTGSVAAASARHPWRAISAWIVLTVLAVVAIATLLGGSLTTEGSPTNNPESERAKDARLAAFPSDPATSVTDIVVIRSDEYTVDSPRVHGFVRASVADARIPELATARPYLGGSAAGLVSEDRHATIVPVALADDDAAEPLVDKVAGIDGGAFAVTVTGEK